MKSICRTSCTKRYAPPPPTSIDILEREGGVWSITKLSAPDLIKKSDTPEILIVFTSSDIFLDSIDLRRDLSSCYQIPACFWTDFCQEASGFFGCQDGWDRRQQVKCHSTWFRFLIKQTKRENPSTDPSYVWDKIGFFTNWLSADQQVILCFDLPSTLQSRLQSTLPSNSENFSLNDPYSLHATIVEEVSATFNNSVWSLRDLVRMVEKNRLPTLSPKPDYPYLHELARHIIHSTETLNVAIETVDGMIGQHEQFCKDRLLGSTLQTVFSNQTRQDLNFQCKLFKTLKSRSQALGDRLQNEINLAFNTVAQYDSGIVVRIGKAAQKDSAAMKTIALLNLVFLPGTFIAAVFGMGFFNFSQGDETQLPKWSMSKDIWIYWAITIPVTAVTVLCWLFLQRKNVARSSSHEV